MTGSGSDGGEARDQDERTWTSETLPLSVRKELLQRELKKFGFRGAAARAVQQQQQPQPAPAPAPEAAHPQAGRRDGSRAE